MLILIGFGGAEPGEGVVMGTSGRWLVAGAVTLAVFAAGAAGAGVLVLPHLMKSGADRWVVAAGVGVAVAALAALWGVSFARGESSDRPADPAVAGDRSIIVTGPGGISGQAATGDGAVNIQHRP
jgi:hypothetical protein